MTSWCRLYSDAVCTGRKHETNQNSTMGSSIPHSIEAAKSLCLWTLSLTTNYQSCFVYEWFSLNKYIPQNMYRSHTCYACICIHSYDTVQFVPQCAVHWLHPINCHAKLPCNARPLPLNFAVKSFADQQNHKIREHFYP